MVPITHPAPTATAPLRRLQSGIAALSRWFAGWPASRWLLLGLVLLGLALRVWFIAVNELQPQYSPADDGDYYQRALRFATTGQYIDDFWLIRPPLHVMLFALMIRVSIILGDVSGVTLIRAMQTAMIVLTIPLGYGLASRLFTQRAGLVFAAILAVWFPLVELPAHLFSEPTFFFFMVLHLWLLVRWRDERHWRWLVAAGLALGFGALARSPTLYGGAFAVLWLVLELTRGQHVEPAERLTLRPRTWHTALRWRVLRPVLVFVLACAVVVVPWTIRNYIVYERFIPIDTIGPVNLWLHLEKYEERGVEILKTMPQADRQVFAMNDVRRMFQEDPVGFWPLLWRNAWPHFLHIWKAQFVEDFFTKPSFYGRPLRQFWLLGVPGDGIWLAFTLAGLMALAAPLREGAFRWLAFCWLAFTIVAMMIMHIEPRYLLPVWLFLALYGSWLLAHPRHLLHTFRQHYYHMLVALTLAAMFLVIFFHYRNYPQMLYLGAQRENHYNAAVQEYMTGDYGAAIRELQPLQDTHGGFVEVRAALALAHLARGDYGAAQATLGSMDAQRLDVVRGALARARGNPQQAAEHFTKAEKQAGENMQEYALRWLRVPPTTALHLGSGHDLGYVTGFSIGEQTQPEGLPPVSYRWLQGRGRIVVPLPEPLRVGSVVELRLSSGRPGAVPLTVGFPETERAFTIPVQSGTWRAYRLLVPEALVGQQELTITLDAPVFIPAHEFPGSVDVRLLSLMVSAVRVECGEQRIGNGLYDDCHKNQFWHRNDQPASLPLHGQCGYTRLQ